jgi:hypothetical protein
MQREARMHDPMSDIRTMTVDEARRRLEILYDRQTHGLLTTHEADEMLQLLAYLQDAGRGSVEEMRGE